MQKRPRLTFACRKTTLWADKFGDYCRFGALEPRVKALDCHFVDVEARLIPLAF